MKDVYTLQDLESQAHLDCGADKPARLGVIGHPIAHSASPKMHQAALDEFGIAMRYIRLDIAPGQIGQAFARMKVLGFAGCNVTVPHKLAAMEYCEVQPQALKLGAVNTIVFRDSRTVGFNTDGPGFENAIMADFQRPLGGMKVVIAGAGGGAGQAIATQCAMAKVSHLVLVNRTVSKLDFLYQHLIQKVWSNLNISRKSFDDPTLPQLCRDCDLVVNASSVGLKIDDPSILPIACLQPHHFVYDTIYQPPVTALLAMAQGLGCQTANGRSMLINQGALAFQHWFPGTEPLRVMERALRPS